MIIVEIPDGGDARTMLSWIIRGFFGGIAEAYKQGSPRRNEAFQVVTHIVVSAETNRQISSDDADALLKEINAIEQEVLP